MMHLRFDCSAMSVLDGLALKFMHLLRARFWRKVQKSDNGCWRWIGARAASSDYGQMHVCYIDGRKKSVRAHRLSWLMHYGAIPYGLLVCHRCDNPACVRPDHLTLGTHEYNTRDMIDKGRAGWQQEAA